MRVVGILAGTTGSGSVGVVACNVCDARWLRSRGGGGGSANAAKDDMSKIAGPLVLVIHTF